MKKVLLTKDGSQGLNKAVFEPNSGGLKRGQMYMISSTTEPSKSKLTNVQKEALASQFDEPVSVMTFPESFVIRYCTPSGAGNYETGREGLEEQIPWTLDEPLVAGVLDSEFGWTTGQTLFIGMTRDAETKQHGLVVVFENENYYQRQTLKNYVKADYDDLVVLVKKELLPPTILEILEDDIDSVLDEMWRCINRVSE